MIDDKDFDKETYKNEAEKIKLSKNQKDILLEKMREADRNFKAETPKKNKIFCSAWIRAVAASLAVAIIGGACYLGISNYHNNDSYSDENEQITKSNIFSITANAAEIENNSVIGMFSGMNGGQFLMKDFENNFEIYKNKLGKIDYFNDYELTKLEIKGTNIESVEFKSNKKGVYFVIEPCVFDDYQDETIGDEQDEQIIYGDDYYEIKNIVETGEFAGFDKLSNSQYTKDEFEEHADGLYGEFCDGFTYEIKTPSATERVIEIGKVINLVIETDRTDSDIDGWMNEYCELDDESHTLRAEIRQQQGESGEVTDEEAELDRKMQELNNKMIKKTVDGAVIDVTVKFTDGSVQTQKINVGFYESNENNDPYSSGITFSYAR